MASARIASPMRGVRLSLSRLPLSRSITTSASSQASVASITTSADGFVPVKPFAEQTVLATIHQFPSLEPVRLETFPANHLYLPTRRDILHRAIVYEGDATRQGTASTKTRYEVHGSSRKIRPQKGSGRARLGDKKSPMLRGGGVAHGPKPRDFSTGLQKKVYDLAWRTALSYRYRKGELIIVDNAIEIESPSKRLLRHIFDLHERERGGGRSLLVTLENRPLLEDALLKMDRRRQALTWREVDVKDLLELSRIIIERSALHNILRQHQSDLHLNRPITGPGSENVGPRYYRAPLIQSAPPDLESTIGWAEFRDLMAAPASERDALRPEVYESVCNRRILYSETLPEGPEKMKLKISAYELLAEAYDLRRAQLPAAGPFLAEEHRLTDAIKDDMNPKELAEAKIAALEPRIRVQEIEYQNLYFRALAAEHRREVYKWKGEFDRAHELDTDAGGWRTDMAGINQDLLQSKIDLADNKAKAAQADGDLEGYKEQMHIKAATEAELEAALAEEAALEAGEETEEHDLAPEEWERIEAEEKKQAEEAKQKDQKESR